jgi:[ribosomal protein S18]-alanine N-acetyltransferase
LPGSKPARASRRASAPSSARIRPARRTDVPAIVALEAHFPSDRLDRRAVRRLLDSPSARILVAADHRLLGNLVLLLRRGSRLARIYSIVVDAQVRGRGLAGRLLDRAEALARSGGRHTMALEVRADNAAALALYARAGYRPARRLPAFYDDGADGLRLQKPL